MLTSKCFVTLISRYY